MQDVGGKIGPFEIRGQLGRGAMAWVWRAWDPALERVVAIKEPIIGSDRTAESQEKFTQRFLREGKAAAGLTHPGIVTVYAAAVYDDRPVLVMELINGPTLRSVFRHGRLTGVQSYALLDQLLDATGYAHSHGVVHRDLKPDNVFVTPDGRVKLADFGIAQIDSGTMLTQDGTMLGTPAYMSPEQIRGLRTDARSDVFSLGVIGYEALAGYNPFSRGQDTGIVTVTHRIVNEAIPSFDARTSELAGPLAEVVLKARQKDPADRYANAVEMRSAWAAAHPEPVDVTTVLARITTRDEPTAQDVRFDTEPTVLDAATPTVAEMPLESTVVAPAPEVESVAEQQVVIPAEAEEEPATAEPESAESPSAPAQAQTPQRLRIWIAAVLAALLVAAAGAWAVGHKGGHAQTAPPTASASPDAFERLGWLTQIPPAGWPPPEPPVGTRVSLKTNHGSVKKGKKVTLAFTLKDKSGAKVIGTVLLEFKVSKKGFHWRGIRKIRVTRGSGHVSQTPSSTRRYRIVSLRTNGSRIATSRSVLVKVKKKKPSTGGGSSGGGRSGGSSGGGRSGGSSGPGRVTGV